MVGSIHLGDLEAPALDTAQHLGTASSAEHESTFEHQAFRGDPETGGSRSMPGSFPEDTPPPSPTAGTNPVPGSLADPAAEDTHASETASEAGDGPHTPSISSIGHHIHPVSDDGDSAHAPEAADPDDRSDRASQAEAGHAGPAAEGEAARPSGRVSRWAAQNHKFGDMFDKALKPYTVPLTVGGLAAGLGIGIYNAVKK